jgi:hypothetical protein
MKPAIILAAAAAFFTGCDSRVNTAPPEKVVEKNTTIINPAAKEEKKVEHNTTIVNPPAREEKKVENNTTIINPPAPPAPTTPPPK